MPSKAFFENVADALTNFLPPALRNFSRYYTSHNLKVWYGETRQEHYEVQHISERALKAAKTRVPGPALEIGFHAEYKERSRNDEVVDQLVARQREWRKTLGRTVEVGPFIGYQSESWRRISELWEDDGQPDAAVEAAERLAAYILTLEPIRAL